MFIVYWVRDNLVKPNYSTNNLAVVFNSFSLKYALPFPACSTLEDLFQKLFGSIGMWFEKETAP